MNALDLLTVITKALRTNERNGLLEKKNVYSGNFLSYMYLPIRNRDNKCMC